MINWIVVIAFIAGIGGTIFWQKMILPLFASIIGKITYKLTFGFMGSRT